MKNKDKKKAGAKKEIKRPSHKKPRPKKYVEAKIPPLPPVPTEQVVIPKEPVVKFEIPEKILGPQTSEEKFVELLRKAATELKNVADNISSVKKSRHPLPETVYYKSGGIGCVLRLEAVADSYRLVEQIAEELRREATSQEAWQSIHKDVVETVENANLTMIKDVVEESVQQSRANWIVRFFRFLFGK